MRARVRKLFLSPFIAGTGRPNPSLGEEYLAGPWTLPLMLSFCIRQPDHGSQSGILRRRMFHSWQMSMFLNPEDPPRRFHQAAPDRQAILTVAKVTSGAASTGVADLEAAPEVTQTKPF